LVTLTLVEAWAQFLAGFRRVFWRSLCDTGAGSRFETSVHLLGGIVREARVSYLVRAVNGVDERATYAQGPPIIRNVIRR
jgi:hypothetical protein